MKIRRIIYVTNYIIRYQDTISNELFLFCIHKRLMLRYVCLNPGQQRLHHCHEKWCQCKRGYSVLLKLDQHDTTTRAIILFNIRINIFIIQIIPRIEICPNEFFSVQLLSIWSVIMTSYQCHTLSGMRYNQSISI